MKEKYEFSPTDIPKEIWEKAGELADSWAYSNVFAVLEFACELYKQRLHEEEMNRKKL